MVEETVIHKFGNFELDTGKYELRYKGDRIQKTAKWKPGEVLQFMIEHNGKFFTNDELHDKIWGSKGRFVSAQTVRKSVERLRKKLDDADDQQNFIQTGDGSYAFIGEVNTRPAVKSPTPHINHDLPLPVKIDDFTRREPQIRQLKQLICDENHEKLVGIWGQTGVGKSALAAAFALEHEERFPAGVRIGIEASGLDTKSLVSTLARAVRDPIGDDESNIPLIMAARFNERRALITIDDLDSAKQIDLQEIIPRGTDTQYTVLVTARDANLLNLVPRNARIPLGPLEPDESVAVLTEMTSTEAVQREEGAVRELTKLVGHLPLGLRIISAWAESNSILEYPFEHFVERLREESSRLSKLHVGNDLHLNIEAAFNLSLKDLEEPERRTFAALAACASSGFSVSTAVAISGFDKQTARDHLLRLTSLALLEQEPETTRLRLHTLLRLFAQSLADDQQMAEAVARHATYFDTYVLQRPPTSLEKLRDLENEREALYITANWKIEHEALSTSFWNILCKFLELHNHWELGAELMQNHIVTAKLRHARGEMAYLYRQLATYKKFLKRDKEALEFFQQSLDHAQASGDDLLIAQASNSLGNALRTRRDFFGNASDLVQQSLDISERLNNNDGKLQKAKSLNTMGMIFRDQGKLPEAVDCIKQGLIIFQDLNFKYTDPRRIAKTWTSLGQALWQSPDRDDAIGAYEKSLAIEKELGATRGVCITLALLVNATRDKGYYDKAIKYVTELLELRKQIGDPGGIAQAHSQFGSTLWGNNEYDDAIAHYRHSEALCRRVDDLRGAFDATTKIGRIHLARKDYDQAIILFEESREIAKESEDNILISRANGYVIQTKFEKERVR